MITFRSDAWQRPAKPQWVPTALISKRAKVARTSGRSLIASDLGRNSQISKSGMEDYYKKLAIPGRV